MAEESREMKEMQHHNIDCSAGISMMTCGKPDSDNSQFWLGF